MISHLVDRMIPLSSSFFHCKILFGLLRQHAFIYKVETIFQGI